MCKRAMTEREREYTGIKNGERERQTQRQRLRNRERWCGRETDIYGQSSVVRAPDL